ncbi:hypothetical protein FRB96_002015 [Tulasnella sp. 330]|nr:hypothetical protein FRB96_002015 [Tulasnella sp. 330]
MKPSKVSNPSKVLTTLSKHKGSPSARAKWQRPTQNAHVALLLSELVMRYVEDLSVKEVMSAGLVCHAWRDGAMEVFWSTKPVNFEMLAHIFAPRDLGEAGIWQWYKHHDISKSISPAKWQAFLRTTRKITWIRLQTTGPYPSLRAIQQLAEKFGGPVLPRVSSVDITARMYFPEPRQLPELDHLFGPTVKHVHVTVGCGLNGPGAVMRRLVKVSGKSIESIHFVNDSSLPRPHNPRFHDLGALRILHLDGFHIPIITLVAISHLTHLTLSGNGSFVNSTNPVVFRTLEALVISTNQPVDLDYVLVAMEMPRLCSFSAKVQPQPVHRGLDHLSKRSPLLKEIKLGTLNESLEASIFQSIRCFRLLRRFDFAARYGITNQIVETLARSIPNIQELRVWQDSPQLKITHRGLRAIAEHCASLRSLSIVVDISRATAVDDLEKSVCFAGNASVKHLVIESLFLTPAQDVQAGKLLRQWFPDVEELIINHLGSREDDKEAIIGAFFDNCAP